MDAEGEGGREEEGGERKTLDQHAGITNLLIPRKTKKREREEQSTPVRGINISKNLISDDGLMNSLHSSPFETAEIRRDKQNIRGGGLFGN